MSTGNLSRKVPLFLFAIPMLCSRAGAQQFAGDWQGSLHYGPVELRLVLHLKTDGAGYTGSLDSIDQSAKGLRLSQVLLDGSNLRFDVDAVHGNYKGTIKGDTISGAWTQGKSLALEFHRGAPAAVERKPGKPSDIDGAWAGTLAAFGGLRVVLHLTNMEDGLAATLDSPDQGLKGSPATAVTRNGETLKFDVKSVAGRFEGKIDAGKEAIEGTFALSGKSSRLKLTRSAQ
jgi:hypothetical protein